MLEFILLVALVLVMVFAYSNAKTNDALIQEKDQEILTLIENNEELIKKVTTLEYELSVKEAAPAVATKATKRKSSKKKISF